MKTFKNSSSSSTNAQETSSFASKKRTTKRRIRKNIQTAKEQTKEQHISENPTEYYQNEFYEFYSNMINFPRQGLQNPLTLSSFTLQSLLLGLLLLILTHTLQTLLLNSLISHFPNGQEQQFATLSNNYTLNT
ncbi:hypothetical protein RIR_jg39615.t1 [Rhizophagus irregularis DAOM 181602=DAOM 197198]|uniref:Uncharacterized protein n=1 Tax=Rhizophagus irregularis (strain DAOM 181602 / DAOM 197198 / MUCL 43194) TaxID=747089 RepID=U9UEY0_RHIID|nr:hypothetical protein RIR_jg39615.t1 [Rhizophagus irregularis DAOM 181602=DAOM 197198]